MRLSRKDYKALADIMGNMYAQAILMGRCVNMNESPREMTPEKSTQMKEIVADLIMFLHASNKNVNIDKFMDAFYEAIQEQWTDRNIK